MEPRYSSPENGDRARGRRPQTSGLRPQEEIPDPKPEVRGPRSGHSLPRISTKFARVALVLAALSTAAYADPAAGPKYPRGYREWRHVKSMVIYSDKHPLFAAFAGIHHVYVNKAGLAALKAHGPFADGSVLVFDLLQSEDADGAYTEGTRKVVAVMQKEAKKYKDTGGWGFQAFKGGNPGEAIVNDPAGQCFNCHQAQKNSDFVFSTLRE